VSPLRSSVRTIVAALSQASRFRDDIDFKAAIPGGHRLGFQEVHLPHGSSYAASASPERHIGSRGKCTPRMNVVERNFILDGTAAGQVSTHQIVRRHRQLNGIQHVEGAATDPKARGLCIYGDAICVFQMNRRRVHKSCAARNRNAVVDNFAFAGDTGSLLDFQFQTQVLWVLRRNARSEILGA
jgi:hypothetical protein